MRLYGRKHAVKWRRRARALRYVPPCRISYVMGHEFIMARSMALPPRGAAMRESRVAGASRPKAQKQQLVQVARRVKPGVVVRLIYALLPPDPDLTLPKPHSIGAVITSRGKLSTTVLDYERYWRAPRKRAARHKRPKLYQWADWRMSQGALGGAWRPSQRKPDCMKR